MIQVIAAALLCAAQDDNAGKIEELRRRHEQAVRELEQQRRKLDEDFRRQMRELGAGRPGEGEPRPRPPEGERPRPPEGERPRPDGEARPRPPMPPPCRCEMRCVECHPRRPEGERPPGPRPPGERPPGGDRR